MQGIQDFIDFLSSVCIYVCEYDSQKTGGQEKAILCFIKKIYRISHYSLVVFFSIRVSREEAELVGGKMNVLSCLR